MKTIVFLRDIRLILKDLSVSKWMRNVSVKRPTSGTSAWEIKNILFFLRPLSDLSLPSAVIRLQWYYSATQRQDHSIINTSSQVTKRCCFYLHFPVHTHAVTQYHTHAHYYQALVIFLPEILIHFFPLSIVILSAVCHLVRGAIKCIDSRDLC